MDITNKKIGIIVTGIATFFFILIHNDLKGFKTMSEETKDVGVESTEVNESKKTKKSKDKKEIEELKAQLQETKDMLLRTAAEFDNYKKRETAAKEKLSTFVKGETLKAILPSLDNINRALSADESSADYAKGVSMTIKGLTDELKKLGLEEINPQGEEFDVNFHMAVMKVDDDSVGQNIVTEVLQTGYRLGDTLLRHDMVKVANCD